jgi:glutamate synthase domain-containing protein 2
LRRNYPILAHFRYGLESIGPEMRQYFIQSDTAEVPFSRLQRALVYQRSKAVRDTRPFGTLIDVYGTDYEWINHSLTPANILSSDFRVDIGVQCVKPYSASVLNISAMSWGALSAAAIRALNEGARRGHFYHDTGEGSLSPYHLENGGDIVWEIGSGYFGCRDAEGHFDPEKFKIGAAHEQVRMIEIKLSQGAKPGHGGVLPAAKVTEEIARVRGVLPGVDCISPAQHTAFTTPIELLQFVQRLRDLSGGKPTGFKLAIGHPWEWFGIAKAMHETQLWPDFIVVDGAEGGTGAAPAEFVDHVGVPMHEALMLVHNTLVGLEFARAHRDRRGGQGGERVRYRADDGEWARTGATRGAASCLRSGASNPCRAIPIVARRAWRRRTRAWKTMDVPDKATRVHQFHENTLHALRELLCAAGWSIRASWGRSTSCAACRRREVRSLAAIYRFLTPGELLHKVPEHAVFRAFWADARSDSFAPPDKVRALRVGRTV